MTIKFPDHLISRFQKLADDFEAHIRADERARIGEKLAAAFPSRPVAKSEPLFPVTDLHGEPLHESGAQPVDLNATHAALISWLSRGTFFAVPTLAGHLGIKKQSVYHYLSGLKKAGYQLEIKSTGNRKGGYVNIYRLAKTG